MYFFFIILFLYSHSKNKHTISLGLWFSSLSFFNRSLFDEPRCGRVVRVCECGFFRFYACVLDRVIGFQCMFECVSFFFYQPIDNVSCVELQQNVNVNSYS